MDTELAFTKAIANEIRQEIMTHLCCEWLTVSDIVQRLKEQVNQPTVSHHLKILEEAGLVHVRRDGKYRYYSLNQEQVTLCCGRLVTRFAPEFAEDALPSCEVKKAD